MISLPSVRELMTKVTEIRESAQTVAFGGQLISGAGAIAAIALTVFSILACLTGSSTIGVLALVVSAPLNYICINAFVILGNVRQELDDNEKAFALYSAYSS